MKKTIVQWLSEFPSGYRELALANYDKGFTCVVRATDTQQSSADALANAFLFGDTPEGAGFWFRVHAHLCNSVNKLPPLPKKPDAPSPFNTFSNFTSQGFKAAANFGGAGLTLNPKLGSEVIKVGETVYLSYIDDPDTIFEIFVEQIIEEKSLRGGKYNEIRGKYIIHIPKTKYRSQTLSFDKFNLAHYVRVSPPSDNLE